MSPEAPNHAPRRRQHVWIVLPAYNEAESLPPLFDRIEETLAETGLKGQVILVDDGSQDGTDALALEAARRFPMEILTHEVNQGLGATIRDGLTRAAEVAAPEDVIVALDADNSHPPELIPRIVSRVREGNDVVVASRYQPGSAIRGVPPLRLVMSYGAGLLFRLIFPISGIRDYTCGYRGYRARILQDALAEEGERFFDQDGFQCMVDILLKLSRRPLVFSEVPLVLRYDLKGGVSKMRVGQTVRKTLTLLLRRRLGLT